LSNTSMSQKVGGRLSSRGWALLVGIAAAILAAILLIVYLDRYRESVNGDNAQTQVFVAKSLITKGTPGTLIGGRDLYQATTLPRRDVKIGAIADPAYIKDRVAVADILPGQQITVGDFTPATTTAVSARITGRQRGVSVPVDAIRMSTTQVAEGDTIDLYVAVGGQIKLFEPNVLVLATPVAGAAAGSYILKMDTADVPDMMAAADSSTLWAAIRPKSGVKPTADNVGSIQTVLKR
jgi:Flp pilus assembly protein CpaB